MQFQDGRPLRRSGLCPHAYCSLLPVLAVWLDSAHHVLFPKCDGASQFPITHQVRTSRTLDVPRAVLMTTPVLVVRVPKTAPLAKSVQRLPSRQDRVHHLKH